MKQLQIFLFTAIFLIPLPAWAANISCMRDNFNAYMTAAEKMHAAQLEDLKLHPQEVTAAVQDQVNWQLSNLKLSKSVFSALLLNAPELINMDAPIANLYQNYLTAYASEGCTEQKCNVDSGKLNGKADQALEKDAGFQAALKENNDLTRLQMSRTKEDKEKIQAQQRKFYTPEYVETWLSSENVKTAGAMGSKSFNQLNCH